MSGPSSKALAIINARLVDPAGDYDGPGAVLIQDGRIVEVIHGARPGPRTGSKSSTRAAWCWRRA